jgi:hypothetical protein
MAKNVVVGVFGFHRLRVADIPYFAHYASEFTVQGDDSHPVSRARAFRFQIKCLKKLTSPP